MPPLDSPPRPGVTSLKQLLVLVVAVSLTLVGTQSLLLPMIMGGGSDFLEPNAGARGGRGPENGEGGSMCVITFPDRFYARKKYTSV